MPHILYLPLFSRFLDSKELSPLLPFPRCSSLLGNQWLAIFLMPYSLQRAAFLLFPPTPLSLSGGPNAAKVFMQLLRHLRQLRGILEKRVDGILFPEEVGACGFCSITFVKGGGHLGFCFWIFDPSLLNFAFFPSLTVREEVSAHHYFNHKKSNYDIKYR